MAREQDLEYEELGPGKGARLTLTGDTAEEVTIAAEKCGIDPSDFMMAAIEAFIKEPSLQAEVIKHLQEETERNGA